ncbi:hypothetical protein [Limnohabitans lacus]|jgi:hypothetical protein|uniref:DUF2802 domain-containing protein n=1 Tax=Limnohabitans lacus TaxID=3045173 RepID=A0ABT6X5U4_9BURK|nr:hypothetical protein [Limnohabitans sp. HM2-2]MDI9233500.1 hypothetical protein [Limnohabitans sp. HM2-2]
MKPRAANQSLSSHIFENLDEIEKLIAFGVYQDSICQQLAHMGQVPTLATFKTSLARARQKSKRQLDQKILTSQQGLKRQVKDSPPPGKRLSADEYGLLEQTGGLPSMPTQVIAMESVAQQALSKLAQFNLTDSEIAEMVALCDRISNRNASTPAEGK